jgi:hypothetical protein
LTGWSVWLQFFWLPGRSPWRAFSCPDTATYWRKAREEYLAEHEEPLLYGDLSLGAAAGKFALSALVVVVTLSVLRLGAVDLAVGNLLGSNLVNLGILGLRGLLYVKAPLLQSVSAKQVGTGVMTVIMTGIAAAEMMYRPRTKALRWMSLGAFMLAFLYAAHIFVHNGGVNEPR